MVGLCSLPIFGCLARKRKHNQSQAASFLGCCFWREKYGGIWVCSFFLAVVNARLGNRRNINIVILGLFFLVMVCGGYASAGCSR